MSNESIILWKTNILIMGDVECAERRDFIFQVYKKKTVGLTSCYNFDSKIQNRICFRFSFAG